MPFRTHAPTAAAPGLARRVTKRLATHQEQHQTQSTSPKRPRLYALDGLRLLAALSVVAFHFLAFSKGLHHGAWEKEPSELFGMAHHIASFGWLGVELFFVVSGFVICMSCWDKTPRDFVFSRVARLYPAYWFSVLTTAAVLAIWPVVRAVPSPRVTLANLTMLQDPLGFDDIDGVYWSLWSEIRFYLVFALVLVTGLTYRRVITFCVTWGLAGVAATQLHSPLLTTFTMPQYAPFFIAGISMYLMYKFRPTWALWAILAGSWLLGLRELNPMVATAQESVHHHVSWIGCATVVTGIFSVILACALGLFDRVRWRWLTVAGALTYPLYLLHEDIGWTVIRLLHTRMPPWVLLALLVTVLLVASWLVHRFVEQPLSRFVIATSQLLQKHSPQRQRRLSYRAAVLRPDHGTTAGRIPRQPASRARTAANKPATAGACSISPASALPTASSRGIHSLVMVASSSKR